MVSFMNVDAAVMRNLVKRVGAGKSVVFDPFGDGRGKEAAKIMRTGPKGVYRQFVDQTEYLKKLSIPWKKTKPFGSREAPKKTMLRTGLYRSAWIGGAGSIEKITKTTVQLGVDSGLFPQVKIHQSKREATRIKPKNRISDGPNAGQWKMTFYIGMHFGIWFTHKRMSEGVLVPRRRVSISSDVIKEVRGLLRKEFGSKMRIGKLTTGASI